MTKTLQIFWQFLLLGCISFGGPAAHIGYFKVKFVDDQKWLTDKEYADLVALSHFLPGPGSSQVGFAIGHHRDGLRGAIAAFLGFTLPSFLLIVLISLFAFTNFEADSLWQGVVHGLKLLAVVVVADALLGMAKSFCKTRLTSCIALLTAALLVLHPSILLQMLLIGVAALLGALLLKPEQDVNTLTTNQNTKLTLFAELNWTALCLFLILFIGLPLFAVQNSWISLASDFYYAGSLVFGGGHVVLPLLQELVADKLTSEQFILGYASAQAMPGPMFSLAAFLGAELLPISPWLAAICATIFIFLPGFLLLLGVRSAWSKLMTVPKLQGASAGINACVVGLLLTAFINPVLTEAITSSVDIALALLGFAALRILKASVIYVVIFFTASGLLFL
ncbi:chromate efflux transporter [Psychrosphaera ytuae]|uniref:Chromate efflux transporter n=1 Tax=Psychrosphaera ytuae TaxID=2820710 RepID=A0A975DEG2_9GAMM|nr:chromate efflux transporter [Psychrosphaera ytuae]QTH64150.1 chromate efflux transporter [Psychrosphaera ytuae]